MYLPPNSSQIGPSFAWLTIQDPDTKHSTLHSKPEAGNRAGGGTGGGGNGGERDIGVRRHTRIRLNSEASCRWLSLSFGTLDDIQPRGRRFEKPLPWTPTHLAYAPISRSIVVAGHHTRDENKCSPAAAKTTSDGAIPAPRSGGEPEGFSRKSAPRFSSSSSLRIFDAETLEERPGGGPLHLLPGVRVTGITLFTGRGRNGNFLNVPLGKDSFRDSFSSQAAAAAVGGEVVAVACCRCATKSNEGQQDGGGWHEGAEKCEGLDPRGKEIPTSNVGNPSGWGPAAAAATTNQPAAHPPSWSAAIFTTVIAAFEVVAYGTDGVDDGENVPDRTTEGTDGDYKGNGQCIASGDGHGTEGSDGGTFLAAVAASPEMEGACFCLETLGERFVAGSTDDKIIVLGWEGSKRGGFR